MSLVGSRRRSPRRNESAVSGSGPGGKYLELAEYLAIAIEITGLDEQTITKVTKLDLADSALHAPAAGIVIPG